MALTATAGSDSKRTIIIVIVALLHVGMYYVIESGLSQHIISILAAPIDTKIIEEEKPPEELPPPPPPPDIVEPPPFIPPPEVTVQLQTQSTAIQVVTNERPPAVVPPVVAPAPKAEVRVMPRQDPKRMQRPASDFYPADAKRRGEEGSVVLLAYVGADGKVTDAKVETSSGFPALDEGAIKCVKTWRGLVPGTVDGVPQPMWWKVKLTFRLEN